ncbi:MAG: FAD-dependent monooxygenase [Bacteroidota bacterium]
MVDLAIIGLGPVGATLAALAGARGLRVVVLERETGPYTLPRAAHLDGEALRILASVGVRPSGRDLDGFDLVDRGGRLLLRGRPAERPPAGFPAGRLIHQPSVERAVRERIAAMPSVSVRLGAEVETVSQSESGVTVCGQGWAVPSRLAVGCDGASSRVREALGVGVDGGRFEQRWLVVDVRLRRGVDLPSRLLQIAGPARPTTYVPFADPRRRWEFRLRDDETREAMTRPEVLRRLLAPHVPPEAVEVERAAVYRFHDLIAARWRRGRILLAGDAAHQMPPFLGQGLGAGLRDADALVPLLARVLRAGAPLGVLDAYETTRRPHVTGVIRQSVRLGRLVGLSRAGAAVRDTALRAAHRLPVVHRALLNVRG